MTHHSLPALRNTRKHFNTMLWDHFKQQEHQKKKAQKCEGQGTKRTYKYYSIYMGWNRRWGVALFDLTWECKKLGSSSFLPIYRSRNDCKSTINIDLEVKLKVGRVARSANMETMDN